LLHKPNDDFKYWYANRSTVDDGLLLFFSFIRQAILTQRSYKNRLELVLLLRVLERPLCPNFQLGKNNTA